MADRRDTEVVSLSGTSGAHDVRRTRAARRLRKGSRTERRLRDEWATHLYGAYGHSTCGRKTRFETRDSAERRAARETADGEGVRVTAYLCGICGGWHLTSHPIGSGEGTHGARGRDGGARDDGEES